MPRPQRQAAINANQKLKTNEVGPRETRDSPVKKEEAAGAAAAAAEPATRGGNARGGGGVRTGVALKKQPAKNTRTNLQKKAEDVKAAAALEPGKMEDNNSEERSGDQPIVEDDATTAPIPDRVSDAHVRASLTWSDDDDDDDDDRLFVKPIFFSFVFHRKFFFLLPHSRVFIFFSPHVFR